MFYRLQGGNMINDMVITLAIIVFALVFIVKLITRKDKISGIIYVDTQDKQNTELYSQLNIPLEDLVKKKRISFSVVVVNSREKQ